MLGFENNYLDYHKYEIHAITLVIGYVIHDSDVKNFKMM